jgi:hypothetical protein
MAGLAGVALILLTLVFHVLLVRPSVAQLDALQRESVTLHERLNRAASSLDDPARAPAEQLASYYSAFPNFSLAPELLRTIYRAADRRGLSLDEGEYEVSRERDGRLVRYRIVLPIRGPYPDVRAFIASALKEIPFLSLDNVAFEREHIEDAIVTARIRLTLYLGAPS